MSATIIYANLTVASSLGIYFVHSEKIYKLISFTVCICLVCYWYCAQQKRYALYNTVGVSAKKSSFI